MSVSISVTVTDADGASATVTVTATQSAASAFPNASNTGVPAGTVLTSHVGDIHLNTAGETIDSLDIKGRVYVQAPNCKITRCRINGNGDWYCIDASASNTAGLLVTDCTLLNSGTKRDAQNIQCHSATLLRNDMSGYAHCISSDGGNLIQDNYMHDLNGDTSGHYECIYIGGGAPGDTIRHNTMISFDTAVVFIKTDYGPTNNNIIDNNLMLQQNPIPVAGLHTTSYTIYVLNTGGTPSTGNQVTNNVMQVGFFGYTDIENQAAPGCLWQNNTDYFTGNLIPTPPGCYTP